jgi:ATP-dependent Lon protease
MILSHYIILFQNIIRHSFFKPHSSLHDSHFFLFFLHHLLIYSSSLIPYPNSSITSIDSSSNSITKILIPSSLYEQTLNENTIHQFNQDTTHFFQFNEKSARKPNHLQEQLQKMVDKLSMIISAFGTKYVNDLLFITFGPEYRDMEIENPVIKAKYQLIQKYVQPIGYKVITWKPSKIMNHSSNNTSYCSNKITDELQSLEDSAMFECYDMDSSQKIFHVKVHGIRIIIQNEKLKKTLVIYGVLDDIIIDYFSNLYIETRKEELKQKIESYQEHEKELMNRIIDTMTFKDILIYGNEDIHKRMISILKEVQMVKNMRLDITIKKFIELDIYHQRQLFMHLLTYNKEDEIKYICFLLYEILSVSSVESSTNEHLSILDSLPFKLRQYFKDIIQYTVKYTNEMTQKYDISKITLEQQIYLMKAPENVKEKAITKYKEIKNKSDENGAKSKQFIEGLLKIPFGIYKEEPILKKMKEMNIQFKDLVKIMSSFFPEIPMNFPKKDKYTNLEIVQKTKHFHTYIEQNIYHKILQRLESYTTKQLAPIIQYIQSLQKIKKNETKKDETKKNETKKNETKKDETKKNETKKDETKKDVMKKSNLTKMMQIEKIMQFLQQYPGHQIELFDLIEQYKSGSITKTINDIHALTTKSQSLESTMASVLSILDDSIYGHLHAKNQMMKIIGQWMNGEQNGYCFGFEGSPGIGKTSLAKKGLANCLTDEDGKTRPFAFIAIGGSCNGSTIEGHGYTYMNSTWGRIVDILMESKCMNPIIYIDELDKVSRTDHGREIISIFTHLIDSTQNESFQDKYFNGIDIDLSKALIIFSYNDPEMIDNVLLDRIHRIKFDNLSIDDKIVIVRKYILPEIETKMGLENILIFDEETIEHIIVHYTNEPGVRKLKELFFDLYGEINLNILQCNNDIIKELPIHITIDEVDKKYFKKYHKINEKKIHDKPEVGIINGLWANSLGRGGIIPIESLFFPSSTFLELRLTGLQGDVMKESMNVAKTLAWNMLSKERKQYLVEEFETTKCQGLHIHCPEGGVSKDGPSAGTAITTTIFSLLNKKAIRHDVAITGEINLQGEIMEIGGLAVKINGGIRAGVKTFLYPKANHQDFIEWREKHPIDKHDLIFHEISYIQEVLDLVLVDE